MAEKHPGESDEPGWRAANRRGLRGKRVLRAIYIVLALALSAVIIGAVIAQPDLAPSAGRAAGWAALAWIFIFSLGRSIRKHRLLEAELTDTAPIAESAEQALRMASEIKDKRRPVLYLRSFGTDPELAQLASVNVRLRWPMRAFLPPRTEEEQFLEAFSLVGPVVAVGDPGRRVSLFGAYRIYISAAAWQEAVTGLMGRSALVVITFTGSPASSGLLWEIEQARQRLKPSVLFILFPQAHSFDAFRMATGGLFARLPAGLPGVPAALAFTGNWEPTLISLSRKNPRNPVRQVNAMIAALAPAFDRTGTRWRRYRFRRSLDPTRMAPMGPPAMQRQLPRKR